MFDANKFQKRRLAARELAREHFVTEPREALGVSYEVLPAVKFSIGLHREKYSAEYIIKHWDEETYGWQAACLIVQTVPATFIEERWDTLHYTDILTCLTLQDMNIKFIESKWAKLGVAMRDACCMYQTLPSWFIEKHWYEFPAWQHLYAYQLIEIELLLEHWLPELPGGRKLVCLNEQCILERIKKEQLPMFLTDTLATIRERASLAMQGGNI